MSQLNLVKIGIDHEEYWLDPITGKVYDIKSMGELELQYTALKESKNKGKRLIVCNICGFKSKSDHGMKVHTAAHRNRGEID